MEKSGKVAVLLGGLCCGGPLVVLLGVALFPTLVGIVTSGAGLAAIAALVVVGLGVATVRRRAALAGYIANAMECSSCEPSDRAGDEPVAGEREVSGTQATSGKHAVGAGGGGHYREQRVPSDYRRAVQDR